MVHHRLAGFTGRPTEAKPTQRTRTTHVTPERPAATQYQRPQPARVKGSESESDYGGNLRWSQHPSVARITQMN